MLKNIKKIGTIFNNKYTNMFKKYSATKKKMEVKYISNAIVRQSALPDQE